KPVDGKEKLVIRPANNVALAYPKTNSKYTVIEPLRLSDFMELQYRAAASMTEAKEKMSAFMSDDIIADMKNIVGNIDLLTVKANQTLDKTQLLIDSSREDLNSLMLTTNNVSVKVMDLTDNLNKIVGDKDFKDT